VEAEGASLGRLSRESFTALSGSLSRRLFHEAQLTEIAVFADTVMFTSYAEADRIFRLRDTAKQAQAAGVVSEAEGTAWLEELEQAEKVGQFFAAMTFFFVSGRKP
jgi:hypothetical protein